MKIEDIHVFWNIIQIVFPILFTIIMAISIPINKAGEPPTLILDAIRQYSGYIILFGNGIFGLITLPYYLAKKFNNSYKLLSVINLFWLVTILMDLKTDSLITFVIMFLLSIPSLMIALYIYFKKK